MNSRRPRSAYSITGRLLWGLVVPLAILAAALGAGGALLIHRISENVNDRLLAASTRAIAETLAVEDGEITLDLPPFALGMLENVERDNIYYNVVHQGLVLTGYHDLGLAGDERLQPGVPQFRYGRYRDQTIRIATEARVLPRVNGVVLVTVAETMDTRRALSSRMLLGLGILELTLVLITAVLTPLSVRWGLRPLRRLRGELDSRAEGADYTPLPPDGAPTELAPLVHGFNNLLRQLERSMESTRRFTADASHQMRTPLSVLRAHLAALDRKSLTAEDRQAALADIRAATQRLERLLLQLLTLARADHEAPLPASPPFDLARLARRIVAELAPMAIRHGIDLGFDSPHARLDVRGVEELAAEIISNLVDNAIRYNRRGGSVTVRVEREHGRAVVLVDDDGPGIPAPDRQKAFDRFHRLNNGRDQTGSGLGLSIVKTLAGRTGGTISLGDTPSGRGLRARFEMEPSPAPDRVTRSDDEEQRRAPERDGVRPVVSSDRKWRARRDSNS